MIDASLPKTIISRKIVEMRGRFSIELVELEIEDEPAYGCRVFLPDGASVITEIYDNAGDPLAIARSWIEKSYAEDYSYSQMVSYEIRRNDV